MSALFDRKEALSNKNLQINMLSISPDDRPVVGNLKHYPNIFLNVGNGQRSTGLAFMSGKALSEIIDETNQLNQE
jgi:glycine/D-amino acid oxidase-like deaminating enzyme